MSDSPTRSGAVLSAADIARLANVRRPAVSNWRRRFADFPRPVAGSATNPLFSLEEVEAWCQRHGKDFHANAADRVWQRAQAVVPGMRMAEFLAHAGVLLTGGPSPAGLPGPDPEWRDLLAEVAAVGRDGGELYEHLCARHNETHARQATPEDVAALMAALGGVAQGGTVLDPACGTGALLLAAARRGAQTFLAQDIDPAAAYITLARLTLAGHHVRVAVGDTLGADGFPTDTAGTVLCDPPFRVREWGHEALTHDPRWRYGLPPRGESELAWAQHCLARTQPGGHAVVRLPGAVARRRAGRRVRANLLRSGALRAIVEPPGQEAETAAQLWLLRRPRGDDSLPTHLLAVHGAGSPGEVERAWAAFGSGDLAGLGEHATAVPIIDLLDEEVDLHPVALRERRREEGDSGAAELASLRAEVASALAAAPGLLPRLAEAPGPRPAGTTLAALVESGALELREAPLTMVTDDGPLPVLTAKDLRLGRPPTGRSTGTPGAVTIHPGDVVVPVAAREGAPRVMREGGALLGPQLLLLRPVDERVDPDFLAGVLEWSQERAHRRPGSSRSDVRAARVPVLPAERQRAYGAALRALADTERRLREIGDLGARFARLGRHGLCGGALVPEEFTDGG